MLLRITFSAILFATISMAQTLSLVSGDGQLVKYGTGTGSAPIVFSILNGTAPVANQTITFTNSDGSPATALIPPTVITNSSGTATAVFYPAYIGGQPSEQFSLQAHFGSQVLSFIETSAPSPQAVLTEPSPTLLEPLTAKAGQSGPQITVVLDTASAGPLANVALHLVPVEIGVPPAGAVVQKATCLEATDQEGDVFTNTSGVASCTPIFTYPNAALNPQYDTFTFKVVLGDSIYFGAFPYNISAAPLTISDPMPNAIFTVGVPATLQLVAAGGVPPYSFSLSPISGMLPGGLSLQSDGEIVGTSNTPGVFPFTVILQDHTGTTITSPVYTIAISGGAFADSPSNIPDAIVGQPYSEDIAISGGVPPYTIAVSGALAPGLTAVEDPSKLSIKISGTPTAPTNASLALKITDAVGESTVLSLFSFQVVAALSIPNSNTQVATVLTPFTYQVPITGGVPPYTVMAAGLPAGLSISATGLISGSPGGAPGVYNVAVSVTDSIGLTASTAFLLDLSGGILALSGSTTLTAEGAGTAFSIPIAIMGGVPPYTFTVVSSPDQSLAISSTGILTGTISAAGSQVVAFTVTDSTGQSAMLSVTIPVIPVITAGGITNAASFGGGATVAPGEIVSLFGSGLGPDTGVGPTLTPDNLISTVASGTTVMFGSFAAPILYVSSTQLNVVVPFEILVGQNVAITVTSNSQTSAVLSVPVVQAEPGIFIIGPSTGSTPQQAAVLNQDLSVNGASNPAASGSVIVIYATGGGVLSAPATDGELPNTLINVADTTVTVGGQPATIEFAGLAPGFAGVLQINATLPSGIATGSLIPLVLTIGGTSSTQTATIAVQ